MTKIINLIAGPGVGKSTLATGIFHQLKRKSISCEYVNEYVKKWAWEDKKVGKLDQLYIFAKQARQEYILHKKVDIIITDSPLLLCAFYDSFYSKLGFIKPLLDGYEATIKKDGMQVYNFYLTRTKAYDARGRYQTEESAKQIDSSILQYLNENNIEYFSIDTSNVDSAISNILKIVKI